MEYYDASKISDFEKCPQLFDYKHNQGYQPNNNNIDLLFGQLLGDALEIFERRLFDGAAVDDAHTDALGHILSNATNPDGTHRFGSFVKSWRCTGETKYVNEKGNPAKCPNSHKGRYFVLPAPEICPCGSKIELHDLWMPTKVGKDIDSLVELLVGYTDAAHTRKLIPTSLNGKPLIEHYWETTLDHEFLSAPVILCGNIDIVKSFGPENFIVDYKSTGLGLTDHYWRQFSPNVQVDLYNMAAAKILPTLNIKGVAIEAFSTADPSPGFKLFRATQSQKAEMFQETAAWISLIQSCYRGGIWPRNRTACYSCPFQKVCSQPPEARQAILDSNYWRGKWNPTARRVEPLPPRQNDAANPSASEITKAKLDADERSATK